MTTETARSLVRARIGAQAAFLALFVFLFLFAGDPLAPSWVSSGFFFVLDPLLPALTFLAGGTVLPLALLALIPLGLTLLLGRFFCGWVCPMGSVQQFFSWALRRDTKRDGAAGGSLPRLKYLILIAVAVAAAAGTQIGGWLDPISLLTRSAASAVEPALGHFLRAGAAPSRVSAQPVLIGTLFLLLIVLNAWRRRFFCVALCPLGALYGLAARFGLLEIRSGSGCRTCGDCSRNCPSGGDADRNHLKSECLVCLNCAAECPDGAVSVRFAWPPSVAGRSVDLGRRRLIGSAALGLAAAALPKGSLEARRAAPRPFLRPPGSVGERSFLDRCMRCGQCAEACPTGFIQPAFLEAGVEGLWTPVLNARAGSCDYECLRCTLACPSGAIEPLTIEQKKRFKIGTAVVDRSRCYTWADGFNCTACADRCPVPGNAIRFHEAETWDYRGNRVAVNQIYVVPGACTGCGICENVCPRRDAPGIVVTAEDEVRESAS